MWKFSRTLCSQDNFHDLVGIIFGAFIHGLKPVDFCASIKNTDYKILIYGEPLAGNIDFIIYKDKKIKLERVAGCIVKEEEVQYWNTYNSVVQKELLEENDVWKLIIEEIKKIKKR